MRLPFLKPKNQITLICGIPVSQKSTLLVLYIWLLRQEYCSPCLFPIRVKRNKRPMVLFGVRHVHSVTTIRGFSLHIQEADAVY